MKIYGKYGNKVSWIVKIYGKYDSKVSWIVKWYGKYGGKVSWIVKKIWKMGKYTTTRVRKKRGENDVTSGHLSSNDVISGVAISGYILKTNNPFLFVLGSSIL